MDIAAEVRIRKRPGTVGRLTGTLSDAGFGFRYHQLWGHGPEHCQVRLVGEDLGCNLHELRGIILSVEGVEEVLSIAQLDDSPVGGEGAAEEPPDNALVNELVWAYPRIREMVADVEREQRPDERIHRLTKLGVEVGTRLSRDDPRLADVASVDQALRDAVVPALEGVAKCKPGEADLTVTSSILLRQNLDMMYLAVQEPVGCCFLSGIIMGMLRQGQRLPRTRVTETSCMERGDPFCRFQVDIVPPSTPSGIND